MGAPNIKSLLVTANEIFPIDSKSGFTGKHSITLDGDIEVLNIWYFDVTKVMHHYYITLNEFDWDDIRGELITAKSRLDIHHS